MARKTKSQENSEAAGYIGIILFLPFLIISVISYNALKREYLTRPSTQRVMDIKRLLPFLIGAGGVMVTAAFFGGIALNSGQQSSSILALLVGVVIIGTALFGGYLVARHLAVLYLGVITDTQAGELYFPYDMQSYGIADYLSLRFIHDFCHVDSIPLAGIERMTRGHRGKDLYLHGKFGSRGITMSSKQKRDECIAMIQSLSGKKSILAMEVEGY